MRHIHSHIKDKTDDALFNEEVDRMAQYRDDYPHSVGTNTEVTVQSALYKAICILP